MREYIKELLTSKNLKQMELANILGISSAAISQWVTPESVGIENVYKICKLFSISVDEFLSKKLKNETIEEKCDRLYNIDDYDFEEIVENKDKEALVDYTSKLVNINERVYDLLYLKMSNTISKEEEKELTYIYKYLDFNVYNSPCFQNDKYYSFLSLDRDLEISSQIQKKISIKDRDNFIWELKKIYSIKNKISLDKVQDKRNDIFDNQTIKNVIRSYTEIERDNLLQSLIYWGDVNLKDFLFSIGVNLLYREDFCNVYIDEEFSQFEGIITPAVKYNEIERILQKQRIVGYKFGSYNLTYDEYQKIIDNSWKEKIKWLKIKETNPIKYWEHIKSQQY